MIDGIAYSNIFEPAKTRKIDKIDENLKKDLERFDKIQVLQEKKERELETEIEEVTVTATTATKATKTTAAAMALDDHKNPVMESESKDGFLKTAVKETVKDLQNKIADITEEKDALMKAFVDFRNRVFNGSITRRRVNYIIDHIPSLPKNWRGVRYLDSHTALKLLEKAPGDLKLTGQMVTDVYNSLAYIMKRLLVAAEKQGLPLFRGKSLCKRKIYVLEWDTSRTRPASVPHITGREKPTTKHGRLIEKREPGEQAGWAKNHRSFIGTDHRYKDDPVDEGPVETAADLMRKYS